MKHIFLSLATIVLCLACETDETPIGTENNFVFGNLVHGDKNLSSILRNEKPYMEFKYDAHGNLESLLSYHDDSVVYTENYTYNDKNQLIKREYAGYTETYSYNDNLIAESRTTYANNPDWRQKYTYHYNKNNRIEKAVKYFNEGRTGFVLYEYDQKGNTTKRKEFYGDEKDPELSSEHKYSYDDHPSPLRLLQHAPIDIVQKNNITYSYFYLITMSGFPPEFNVEYQYGADSLPLVEKRSFKGHYGYWQPDTFTYVYRE
jgi:hypothetical protein